MRPVSTPIALATLILMLIPGSIWAGEIRGNVLSAGSDAKVPARYVVRGQSGSKDSKTISARVAIALENLDGHDEPNVPDTAFVMAQENTSFVPNLLVVPLGARVTFPNRDAIFHNVFSYSPPRSFDLGRYPKGETRTVKFEEPGIVRVFCEIHASMYATILVSPSEHYTIINSLDGFSFGDLPAGRYRIVAVDAAGRKAKQDVDVKESGSVSVSLTLE